MTADASRKSGDMADRGKMVLGSLGFDRYADLCTMLAEKLGMKVSERELTQEMLLLKGAMKGRECTGLCTLPGVNPEMRKLGSMVRSAGKAGGVVIILSPEQIAVEAGDNRVMAVVAGDEFTRMASRTSVFKDELENMHVPEKMSAGDAEEKRRFNDMLRYARQRYDAGDLGEAAGTVDLLLTLRPGADELYRLRGNIFLKNGRNADAAAAFSEAVRYGATNTENLAGKATALYRLGDYAGELECYDRILKLDPSHRTALQNRGAALQQTGRFAEAVAAYEAAISRYGKDAGLLRNLSLAYYNLHNTDGALRALDAVLSSQPSDERATRLKGLILAEQGSDDALEYLRRYSSFRDDADVLGVIASICNRKGMRKEAMAFAARALRIDPGNSIAAKEFDAASMGEESEASEKTDSTALGLQGVPEEGKGAGTPQTVAPRGAENQATEASRAERRMLGPEEIADMVEKEFGTADAVRDALRLLQAVGTQQATGAIDIVLERMQGREGYRPAADIMRIAEKRAFDKGDFAAAAKMGREIMSEGRDREGAYRLLASLIGLSAFDEAIELTAGLDGALAADVHAGLRTIRGRAGKAARLLASRDGGATSSGENNAGALMMMREGAGDAVNYYSSLPDRGAAGAINRSVSLYLRGDRALALELLAGEPARMWQHSFNLGYMLLDGGRTEKAIDELARAAELKKDADALNVLGVALAHADRNAEAKKRFEEALSVDGRHRAARRNLKHIERTLRR